MPAMPAVPTAIIILLRKINSTDAEVPLSCTSQKPDTSDDDAHPFYLVTDAGKKRCSTMRRCCISVDIFLYNQKNF